MLCLEPSAGPPGARATMCCHEPETKLPEVGPIRPPSESFSLLVRVSRNCPFNRCAFCPVYKGTRFSLRSVDEVCADIDAMAELAAAILARAVVLGSFDRAFVAGWLRRPEAAVAMQVARFLEAGGRTAFLQDANSVIMPPGELVRVLEHLRRRFPSIERVTSYARSHTLTKRSVDELVALRQAGLGRIHVGLESGADEVLALVDKGASAERHIEAAARARAAGMVLSVYVMPGLGGAALSDRHADETARVLRAMTPDVVRVRTLAIAPGAPLASLVADGRFVPLDDLSVVRELRRMLVGLADLRTTLRSDHVLNLFEELSGHLPDELERLLALLDRFLALDPLEQELYVAGRRLGGLRRLDDLDDPALRRRAADAHRGLGRRYPGPFPAAIARVTSRFV